VGPALENVYNRAPSIEWIKAFIKNSAAVIASGDEYAVKLYNEFGKTQMTAFSGLKDDQIMAILAYIQDETKKGPPVAAAPVAAADGGGQAVPTTYLNAILIGMVIILVLLVVILGFLVSALKRFLDQKTLSEERAVPGLLSWWYLLLFRWVLKPSSMDCIPLVFSRGMPPSNR